MSGYLNAGLYYGGGYYGGWPGFERQYNLTKYLLGYPGYERPPAYDYRLEPQPFLPYGYGGYGGWYTTPYGADSMATWRRQRPMSFQLSKEIFGTTLSNAGVNSSCQVNCDYALELSGTLTRTSTQQQRIYCWNLLVNNRTGRVITQDVDLCLDIRSVQTNGPFVLGPGIFGPGMPPDATYTIEASSSVSGAPVASYEGTGTFYNATELPAGTSYFTVCATFELPNLELDSTQVLDSPFSTKPDANNNNDNWLCGSAQVVASAAFGSACDTILPKKTSCHNTLKLSGASSCTTTQQQKIYCWNLLADNQTGRILTEDLDLCLDIYSVQTNAPFVLGPGIFGPGMLPNPTYTVETSGSVTGAAVPAYQGTGTFYTATTLPLGISYFTVCATFELPEPELDFTQVLASPFSVKPEESKTNWPCSTKELGASTVFVPWNQLTIESINDDGTVTFALGNYYLFGSTTLNSRPLITQTLFSGISTITINNPVIAPMTIVLDDITVVPDGTVLVHNGNASWTVASDARFYIYGVVRLSKSTGISTVTLTARVNGIVVYSVGPITITTNPTEVTYEQTTSTLPAGTTFDVQVQASGGSTTTIAGTTITVAKVLS